MAFDYQLERLDENRTTLDFVVESACFLEPIFGRLNATYLGRKLDRTSPVTETSPVWSLTSTNLIRRNEEPHPLKSRRTRTTKNDAGAVLSLQLPPW